MHVDTPTQPLGAVAVAPADVRVDSLPTEWIHSATDPNASFNSASPQRLRPPGDAGAKRGRGRPKLGSVSPRTGEVIRAVAERQSPTGWLADVKTCLTKADGLTDGQLPVRLAQAVAMRSESMTVLDVVAAFEKCENMALKLKAARFLKDTSKGTIEELRSYAAGLLTKEDDDGDGMESK